MDILSNKLNVDLHYGGKGGFSQGSLKIALSERCQNVALPAHTIRRHERERCGRPSRSVNLTQFGTRHTASFVSNRNHMASTMFRNTSSS